MNKFFAFLTLAVILGLSNRIFAQDYAITRFVEPATGYFCTGASVFNRIELSDSGSTGIATNALVVHWTLSGGISGMLAGPSAPVAIDGKDTLELDTFAFNRPGAYLLTVYIDSLDTNNTNDTIRTVIHIGFNGLYTVDPALPASGNNFKTVAAICDTISQGGVCGPVEVEIASGTYNEQAKLNRVHGVSATNTIHITSAAHDSSAVTISYTPAGAADNYVFCVNATSFLTLSDLTLKTTGNASFSRILTIDSMSTHNHYRYLHFKAGIASINSTGLALIYSNPGTETNDSLSIFENNTFSNGAYGMYMYGATSFYTEDSLIIRNNVFSEQFVAGIFMYYQSNTIIDSNVVITHASTSNFSAIYIRYGGSKMQITRNSIFADGAAGDIVYLRDLIGNAMSPILFANNFIVQRNNASTLRGIYPYNCENLDIAFNTIRMQGGSTTGGRAIYINSSTTGTYGNIRLIDNIFENTGGGYAIEISSGAITQNYVWQCDYNHFIASGTNLGRYGSTNCSNLTAWQASATGFDLHSVSIDPIFTGIPNVEFTNSALNGLGSPFSVVLTDIAGTLRNITTPDMGAYEYELYTHDLSLFSIDNPVSGCGLSTAESITISIYNNGSVNESTIPVQFSINGGSSWSLIENVPLVNSGDTVSFTFAATANLSVPAAYYVMARIELAGDENISNDSRAELVNSLLTINAFPYAESFELGDGGWASSGTNSSWQLGDPADTMTIDTASNGLKAWVTNLTGTHNLNELSFVESPCFDLSGMSDPWLDMDIWYEAETGWDGAQVQYSTDGGNSWILLGHFGDPNWYNDYDVDGIANNAEGWSGNNGNGSNGWMAAQHSLLTLTAYSGTRLRVVFGAGSFNNDDGFAFDNVRISDRGVDIALLSVDAPTGGCGLAQENITFTIQNNGTLNLSSVPVKISIDGGSTWTNDTIVQNVLSGSSAQLVSNITFDLSPVGEHQIIVIATAPTDISIINDTAQLTIISQPLIAAFPHFDNVDAGAQMWMPLDTLWKKGIPNGTTINSSFSGTKAYSTCTIGVYGSGATGIIESPCFDFSTLGYPQIEFNYFCNTDSITDGIAFQYTTDGTNWFNIGAVNDTLNWYNHNAIVPLSGISLGLGWTGNSQTTWKLAHHIAPQLAGESWVKFRFVLASSSVGSFDGFAFDDFSVYELPIYELAVISIDSVYDACMLGIDSVSMTLQNTNSLFTIPAGDSIVVVLNSDLLAVATDTIILSSPLLPLQTIAHTFSQLVDLSMTAHSYLLEAILYNQHDVDAGNNTDTLIINNWGYPTVDLPTDTTLCDNQNIILNAGAGADSYLWSTGQISQSLMIDTSFTGGIGSELFYVDVTTNGCTASDSIEITFTSCLSIDETIVGGFVVYPNPASDYISIKTEFYLAGSEVFISDMTGRIVAIFEINNQSAEINIASIPSGIYSISIETDKIVLNELITIQR